MNLGGGISLPFGRVQMTIAYHSSALPDGSERRQSGGFVLTLADGKIYFACDTALFSDMERIGTAGDRPGGVADRRSFHDGPRRRAGGGQADQPRRVVPSHYNTWPPILQDAAAWAARVRQETSTEPIVLEPGGKLKL